MKMIDLLQGDGVAIEVDQGQIVTYAGLRVRVDNCAGKWRTVFCIGLQSSSCGDSP